MRQIESGTPRAVQWHKEPEIPPKSSCPSGANPPGRCLLSDRLLQQLLTPLLLEQQRRPVRALRQYRLSLWPL